MYTPLPQATARSMTGKKVIAGEDPDEVQAWEERMLAAAAEKEAERKRKAAEAATAAKAAAAAAE